MRRWMALAVGAATLAGCGTAQGGDPWAEAEQTLPGFRSPYVDPWETAQPMPPTAPGYGYAGKRPLFGTPGVGFAGQRPLTGCFRDALNNVFCDQ